MFCSHWITHNCHEFVKNYVIKMYRKLPIYLTCTMSVFLLSACWNPQLGRETSPSSPHERMSACWNFLRKNPNRETSPSSPHERMTGLVLPSLTACTRPTWRRSSIPCDEAAREGDLVANLVWECTAHTALFVSHMLRIAYGLQKSSRCAKLLPTDAGGRTTLYPWGASAARHQACRRSWAAEPRAVPSELHRDMRLRHWRETKMNRSQRERDQIRSFTLFIWLVVGADLFWEKSTAGW
jgi:hypothetical protein